MTPRTNRSLDLAPLRSSAQRCRLVAGFTIVEVLVSLLVVSLLVAMLLPTLERAREAARRVVCATHQRDLGLGILLYADDNADELPPTVFIPDAEESPSGSNVQYHLSSTVRLDASDLSMFVQPRRSAVPFAGETHDGLGLLYAQDILPTPETFYCPSHVGPVQLDAFRDQWYNAAEGRIVGNYQYRGGTPDRVRRLEHLDSRWGLASDALRTVDELNHRDGLNVLDGTLAVGWLNGIQPIESTLPLSAAEAESRFTRSAWLWVDRMLTSGTLNGASGVDDSRNSSGSNGAGG